jgi:predicted ATPase
MPKLRIDIALKALKMLGVALPQKPNKLIIFMWLIRTKLAVGNKRIEDLAELPPMTDANKIAALRTLNKYDSGYFYSSTRYVPTDGI